MRPKAALSGAGGAGAAGGRSTAASEQTRMDCSRTATDSNAEKSGGGAGGAGVAEGTANRRAGFTAEWLQTCMLRKVPEAASPAVLL